MSRSLYIFAGVVILTPLAFTVLAGALLWNTAVELARAAGRSTQWSPR